MTKKSQVIASRGTLFTLAAGEVGEVEFSILGGELSDWTVFVQRQTASDRNIKVGIQQETSIGAIFIGRGLGAAGEPPADNEDLILPVAGAAFRAFGSSIKVRLFADFGAPQGGPEIVKVQAFPSEVRGFVTTRANGAALPTFATAAFCLESNQGLYFQDLQDHNIAIITEFNQWIPIPANCHHITTESGDDPVLIRLID